MFQLQVKHDNGPGVVVVARSREDALGGHCGSTHGRLEGKYHMADAARVCVLTHPSSSSSEGEEEELLEDSSSLPELSSSSSSVLRSISCSISGKEVQLMVCFQTWDVGVVNKRWVAVLIPSSSFSWISGRN